MVNLPNHTLVFASCFRPFLRGSNSNAVFRWIAHSLQSRQNESLIHQAASFPMPSALARFSHAFCRPTHAQILSAALRGFAGPRAFAP